MSNYQYPIDPTWTKEELVAVIDFLTCVEEAYEGQLATDRFDQHYQRFRQVINSKAGEKQIDKAFQAQSGYSIYQVVKRRQAIVDQKTFSMK